MLKPYLSGQKKHESDVTEVEKGVERKSRDIASLGDITCRDVGDVSAILLVCFLISIEHTPTTCAFKM